MANGDTLSFDPSSLIPSTGVPAGGSNLTAQDLSRFLGQGQSPDSQQTPVYASLSQARAPFAQQLQNPELRRLLMASTSAEVAGQGPAAEQAYIESVMNRASAEGRQLAGVLLDHTYYPKTTTDQLGARFGQASTDRYNALINSVLNGSNVSNLGTGNESGKVRSGGAAITFNPGTGERFVEENWTKDWRRNTMAALTNPPQTQQIAQQQPAQQQARNLTIAQYMNR